MLKGLGNVVAAVAALGGSLIRAELGFYLRPEDGSDVRAEEPPEAGGELEGAHPRRVFSAGAFEDPDQEVNRVTENQVEFAVGTRGSPYGLAEETGGEADAKMVDLVGLVVNARGAAALL